MYAYEQQTRTTREGQHLDDLRRQASNERMLRAMREKPGEMDRHSLISHVADFLWAATHHSRSGLGKGHPAAR